MAARTAVVCASASASPGRLQLALESLTRTRAGSSAGTRSWGLAMEGARFGVSNRANFIFELGPNETIFGGGSWNELGAVANAVTIHAGRGIPMCGGGPRGTLVGGAGKDMLIDLYVNVTVRLQSAGDEVVLSGRDDRVLCSPTARHELIYVAPSDAVSSRCRADHNRILRYHRFASSTRSAGALTPPARTAASPVIHGDGSNEKPFQPDTCGPPQLVSCKITFELVPMNSFGTGKYWTGNVPAYTCPGDHPYLEAQDFTPPGSRLPLGVEVQEDWGNPPPIAFNITGCVRSICVPRRHPDHRDKDRRLEFKRHQLERQTALDKRARLERQRQHAIELVRRCRECEEPDGARALSRGGSDTEVEAKTQASLGPVGPTSADPATNVTAAAAISTQIAGRRGPDTGDRALRALDSHAARPRCGWTRRFADTGPSCCVIVIVGSRGWRPARLPARDLARRSRDCLQ